MKLGAIIDIAFKITRGGVQAAIIRQQSVELIRRIRIAEPRIVAPRERIVHSAQPHKFGQRSETVRFIPVRKELFIVV